MTSVHTGNMLHCFGGHRARYPTAFGLWGQERQLTFNCTVLISEAEKHRDLASSQMAGLSHNANPRCRDFSAVGSICRSFRKMIINDPQRGGEQGSWGEDHLANGVVKDKTWRAPKTWYLRITRGSKQMSDKQKIPFAFHFIFHVDPSVNCIFLGQE